LLRRLDLLLVVLVHFGFLLGKYTSLATVGSFAGMTLISQRKSLTKDKACNQFVQIVDENVRVVSRKGIRLIRVVRGAMKASDVGDYESVFRQRDHVLAIVLLQSNLENCSVRVSLT